jgi:hypothetical protein
MLSILGDILHGILDIPYLIVGLLVTALNGWILAIAALAVALMAVLPSFPELPSLGPEVIGGIAWFLPVAGMVAIFAGFVTLYLVWLGVSIGLRWVKAL